MAKDGLMPAARLSLRHKGFHQAIFYLAKF
jgi:hypothetical protein